MNLLSKILFFKLKYDKIVTHTCMCAHAWVCVHTHTHTHTHTHSFPDWLLKKGKVLVAPKYPTLCEPMDYIPQGSSVHGILQARMLEWAAIPFSRGTGLPWWFRCSRIHLQWRRPGFNPWVRKIPWIREWPPTPVFLPGEFHRLRSLAYWQLLIC